MSSQRFEKRSSDTEPGISTASLPDIVFMLLIFFMVSTVLRETEIKVQTRLPSAEALTKIEQKRLISYVYIGPRKTGPNEQQGETAIQIDDALIETQSSIRQIMYSKLQEQPKLIVSLKVDRESPMRVVNEVQQELREANALRINYSSTRQSGSQ
jgi:biopolymer transport protein ExbD